MQQSHEDGARPRTGRAWEPLRLLCCVLPRSANQISPMPGRTAGAGVSTVVAGSMVTDLADPMVADSTPDFAGFMVTDLTVAGSTAQGIAASRSGTMVSPTGTRASGPMAGAMEAAAGGAVPGWDGFSIRTYPANIHMAATTIMGGLLLSRHGITVPTRQDTSPT